jgi:hypothetical protein
MAASQAGLFVTWFTAGGQPGLYFTKSLDNGTTFQPRQLLSEEARHPQIVASGEKIVAVWDEAQQQHTMHAGHSGHSTNHSASGAITFSIIEENVAKIPGSEGAEFPVVYAISADVSLVAYSKDGQVITRIVKH